MYHVYSYHKSRNQERSMFAGLKLLLPQKHTNYLNCMQIDKVKTKIKCKSDNYTPKLRVLAKN